MNNPYLKSHFMQSSSKTERLFSTVLLLLIIAFGVFIRVQNRDALESPYLLGTDSYRYFRQTRQIVESGELPRLDTMRNSPDGIDNTTTTPLFPYVLANVFAAVHTFFPSLTLYPFATFSSIFSISLAALLFYALTNRLFGKIAALFATLIFVSTTPLILVSFTGYVDTDAIIILFFLGGISVFYESCQAQLLWKRCVYALFSGIILSFLGLMWKGVGFAIAIVVLFSFLRLCGNRYNKADIVQYAIWILPIFAGLLGLTKLYRTQLLSPHVLLAVGVPIGFGILASLFIIIQSRNASHVFFSMRTKVPLGLAISVLLLFLGCLFLTLTHRSFNWISTLIYAIFYPFGKNGVMEFVAELHPSTLILWQEAYGLLLLFAIPSLCLFSYPRASKKRTSFVLHCLLTGIALFGIAVSRFVSLLTFPVPWLTDSLIFAVAVTLIVANTLYQFSFTTCQATKAARNEDHNLLIVAWFLPSYMMACAADRFHLFLAPLVAMLSGYMLNKLFKKYMTPRKKEWQALIFLGVLLSWQLLICGKDILSFLLPMLRLPEHLQLIITLSVTAIFFGFLLQSLLYRRQTQYSVPKACAFMGVCLLIWLSITGIYRLGPTQAGFMHAVQAQPIPQNGTRDALKGMKTNIPDHAVIAANWNMGSFINELGKRTTIVDEEQNLAKIRAMSQAVFCGTNEDEALHFLKEQRATHLLLHPMDILQLNLHFFAAKKLGENTRRIHPVTTLNLSEASDQKLEYDVDTPVYVKINTEAPQETVKRMILPFFWENESFSINSPASIVMNDDNPEQTFSVKELIIADRQWYFPEAKIGGCVWKPSEIVRDRQIGFMDSMVLYFSPEAREYFTVKLFFGEHSDHFKLIYESPKFYGVIPIKIWEIQYEGLLDNEK